MGIVAALEIKKDSPDHLTFSTGYGTWKAGMGIIIFGLVILIMWLAIRPLFLVENFPDPLLQKAMPILLWLTSASLTLFGLLVLGFQKKLDFDQFNKKFGLFYRIWGFTIKKHEVLLDEISSIETINRTPKRYRPEMNLKKRAVGFWELDITTTANQKIAIDQAPEEREIRFIEEKIKSFLQKNRDRP